MLHGGQPHPAKRHNYAAKGDAHAWDCHLRSFIGGLRAGLSARLHTMDALTSPTEDTTWRALLAQHEMVQAAMRFAWSALIEAYQPGLDGHIVPDPELVARYREASALLRAAERALLTYIETSGPRAPTP